MSLTNLPQWHALQKHYQWMRHQNLNGLFKTNPNRFQNFSLNHADIFVDFSKNLIIQETIDLLIALATAAKLPEAMDALFKGESVNTTENLPALHPKLRDKTNQPLAFKTMYGLIEQIKQRPDIKHIIHLGIGGSYLGPKMAVYALAQAQTLQCHFISHIGDPILKELLETEPNHCLLIAASKSFNTIETIMNLKLVLAWFNKNKVSLADHCFAITQFPDKAKNLGIPERNILTLDAGIGGRYSLCSVMGLTLALMIGIEPFNQFLAGAYAMDQHFINAPLSKNIPVLLGLINLWYRNFYGSHATAILPYHSGLKYFPAYLQQLIMESQGKSIRIDRTPVDYATGPIVFGEFGLNAQHSFYQLLHQGTELIPIDFIMALHNPQLSEEQQQFMIANVLSQSRAFMTGKTTTCAHETLPGNRPSTILALTQLSPFTLGALVALYEHKVFVESVIWQINPFDQWSVNYGKQLCRDLLHHMKHKTIDPNMDDSTQGWLTLFQNINRFQR
jgi:glucose-6-phosphate isomerase